jgi:drug/metabolite transporter (DMT)-like permease
MFRERLAARPFFPDRHTLCGLLAILLWSSTVALARSLAEQLGPLTAAAAVYLTGGILCLVTAAGAGRPVFALRPFSRLYLFGCGALFVLYMFALFQAIGLAADRRQVLEVGMVNYLWPSLTIALSLALLRKRARLLLIPGILLALLGEFLVLAQGTDISWASVARNLASNPPAYLLALVAAVSWGLYSNLTRRWAGTGSGGGVPLFMLATSAVLLAMRLLSAETSDWNLRACLEVLFLGLATALAYVCWDAAMRRGDVVLVAAWSYFTPLFSTLVSCAYLGVAADARLWIGCLAIIAGSLLSWISVDERAPAR